MNPILILAQGPIRNIIFSPNGHYMASTGEDKRVLLWELRHGNLIRELNDHTEPIFSLSFCQDGNVLASGKLKLVFAYFANQAL